MTMKTGTRFVTIILMIQLINVPFMTTLGRHPKDAKILVLGAGMSGIKASKTLHEKGYTNLRIIEGTDRIGGRMKESTLGNYTVENGAFWIYGRGTNPVWKLAQKFNISTIRDDSDNWQVFDYDGNDVTKDANKIYNKRFGPAVEKTTAKGKVLREKCKDDFSVRASLITDEWFPKSPLDEAIEFYMYDYEYAAPPEEISTKFSYPVESFEFHGDDRLLHVNDPRGYAQIVRSMAEEFLVENDPRLHLKEIVTSVKRGKNKVTVRTSKAKYRCDYVIVTFSLGVLQHRRDLFKPSLPVWKQDAIDQFAMERYEQVYFQFPTNFWGNQANYFMFADRRRGYLHSWINMEYVYPGSKILQVGLDNNEALRLARMSDSEVIDEAVAVLKIMFKNVTIPTGFVFNRWTTDPLFHGAYSNWPVGYEMNTYRALLAPVGRIFFAGEHLSDIHFGFTHGAYYSGKKTATDLIACLKTPSACPQESAPPSEPCIDTGDV